MRSEGYGTWSVGLSVCLSVRASSRTTGYVAANEWHQPVVNNRKMDTNVAIFLKRLHSRDMAWKQAKKPTCGRSREFSRYMLYTRRPMSGTNGLWTTRRWIWMWRFSWNDCVPDIWRENKRKIQRAVDRAPSPAGYIERTRHVNFSWSTRYATLVVYTIYGLQSVLISVLNGKTCWAKVCPQCR